MIASASAARKKSPRASLASMPSPLPSDVKLRAHDAIVEEGGADDDAEYETEEDSGQDDDDVEDAKFAVVDVVDDDAVVALAPLAVL